MGRAFPFRSDCPVPSNSAITGVLVSSCAVPDAPPPIFQFPPFEFPLPNPPGFNFGCYGPSATVDYSVGVVGSAGVDIEYPNASETGQCQPLFRFNIKFPTVGAGSCPEMSAEEGLVTFFAPPFVPFLSMAISSTEGSDNCKFTFDLKLQLPGTGANNTSEEEPETPLCLDGDSVFTVFEPLLTTSTTSSGTTLTLEQIERPYRMPLLQAVDNDQPATLEVTAGAPANELKRVATNIVNIPLGGLPCVEQIQLDTYRLRVALPPADNMAFTDPDCLTCGTFQLMIGADLFLNTDGDGQQFYQLDTYRVCVRIPELCTSVSGDPPPSGPGSYTPTSSARVVTGLSVNDSVGCDGPPPGPGDCAQRALVVEYTNIKFVSSFTTSLVSSAPGEAACCDDIEVVTSLDSLTFAGNVLTLTYSRVIFTLPTVTRDNPDAPGTPVSLATTDSVNLMSDFTVSTYPDDECGACGKKIKPVLTAITAGGVDATILVVCGLACSSTDLVVSTRTLVFGNGILTDAGTCT